MPHSKRTATGVLGGIAGLVGLSVVAGVLVTATITPALAATSAAATGAINMFDNLPSALAIDKLPLPTTIYYKNADTGQYEVMTKMFDQNRVPVQWDQIAPVMYDAILSSEDPRFYQHGGIDLIGTSRALLSNLKGDSNIQGGSSISQQYVKNVLVQQCYKKAQTEKTAEKQQKAIQECYVEATNSDGTAGIQRKLQEMRYAIALEQKYSKNDILLGYLNIANFGGTTYGIEAAAEYYFGVHAKDLNYEQAATLAGMVQNPNLYRIDMPNGTTTVDKKAVNTAVDGYALTKQRESYVLRQMHATGKITDAQYQQGLKDPIAPSIHQPTTGCAATAAPYFCAYVMSVLSSDTAFGKTQSERDTTLRQGGLNVYTTLDMRLQDAAQQTISQYAPATVNSSSWTYGATIVNIENSTGRVLSMAQNTTYTTDPTPQQGKTGIVYAGDLAHGGSVGFAPGSTFKIFTLLDWLEQGRSLNERVDGTVHVIKRLNNSCGTPWINYKNEMPGNYEHEAGRYGTPLQFTAISLNSGFFGMASQLDMCDVANDAAKLDVTNTDGTPIKMDYLNSVIGNTQAVSPLAMGSAYATIANNGVQCDLTVIDKITDSTGKEQPLPQHTCTQKVDPNVAASLAYALQGPMKNSSWGVGTAVSANPNDGTQVIGKTGTNEATQTWLIQSSTAVTSVVWSGVADGLNSPSANVYRTSYKRMALQSIRYPMSKAIQRAADHYYPGGAFPAPDPALTKQVLVSLPNVVGMSQSQAQATLQNAGFPVTIGAAVDSNLSAGTIAAQSPAAGQVPSGTTVTLSPSNGQGIVIPDVSGQDPDAAVAALRSAGFGNVTKDPATCRTGAKSASTNPVASTMADANTAITVVCTGGNAGPGAGGTGPGGGSGPGGGGGNH